MGNGGVRGLDLTYPYSCPNCYLEKAVVIKATAILMVAQSRLLAA
jgi:hypothetical protein